MAQHVLVTGGSRGLGLALTQHYLERGDRVTVLCRTLSSELKTLSERASEGAIAILDGVELTNSASIAKVKHALVGQPIHLLLNVAGIMLWETLAELNPDDIRRQFEINALAPLCLTATLADNLPAGAKVIFLTSRLGSMTDNTSGNGYGYRMSKAALNMAAVTLAVDLKPCGVIVGLIHPGSVKTSLNQLGGEIEVAEAIAGITHQIQTFTLDTSGHYIHQNGTPLPW